MLAKFMLCAQASWHGHLSSTLINVTLYMQKAALQLLGLEVSVLSVSERVADMSRPSPSCPPLELDAVVLLVTGDQ